jgi:hypothetical protein
MSAQTPSHDPGRAYAEPAHILAEWAKWILPPGATWWLTDSLVAASKILFIYLTARLLVALLPTASKLLRRSADLIDQAYHGGKKLRNRANQTINRAARATLLWALRRLQRRHK